VLWRSGDYICGVISIPWSGGGVNSGVVLQDSGPEVAEGDDSDLYTWEGYEGHGLGCFLGHGEDPALYYGPGLRVQEVWVLGQLLPRGSHRPGPLLVQEGGQRLYLYAG
jgi:hypothetical protein